MAKPTLVRNLSTRLRPLGKPAIWVPLTICTLLGVFSWELSNNPDWFNRAPSSDLTSGADLTPEEEAKLSEIDTVDNLLESTRLAVDAQADAEGALSNAGDGSTGILEIPNPQQDGSLASKADPFAAYRADYEFPSSAAANRANGVSPSLGQSASRSGGFSSSGSSLDLSGNLGTTAPASSGESELSKAVARQAAARDAEPTAQNSESSSGNLTEAISAEGIDTSLEPVTTLPVDNLPESFIRTTPNMSPPVGTTGYTPPATANLPAFNVQPPQPTRNPLNVAPAAPIGQAAPLPAAQPSALPGAAAAPSGALYTAPTFSQPDQGRPINPRRF